MMRTLFDSTGDGNELRLLAIELTLGLAGMVVVRRTASWAGANPPA
jgi:hypothetical protein